MKLKELKILKKEYKEEINLFPIDSLKKQISINKEASDNYAIEFAEWLFLWKQNSIGEWKHQNKNKIINSTKELLKIFKKEKGL